jgi:hypothetical protein
MARSKTALERGDFGASAHVFIRLSVVASALVRWRRMSRGGRSVGGDARARAGVGLGQTLAVGVLLLISGAARIAEAQSSAHQGFGAITLGGRGGALVRVTTLDDAGKGSLREALRHGHRTIVFDVAGEIALKSHLYVQGAFVTIDGLSAPPPGITLRGHGLVIRGNRGAHDVIVRGIRVRDSAIDGIDGGRVIIAISSDQRTVTCPIEPDGVDAANTIEYDAITIARKRVVDNKIAVRHKADFDASP